MDGWAGHGSEPRCTRGRGATESWRACRRPAPLLGSASALRHYVGPKWMMALPIPSTYGESSKQIRRPPTAAMPCLPRAWLPMPYQARWFLMECPTVRNLPAVASSGLPLRWVTARVPIPSKMVGPAGGDANVQCSSYLSLCHRKYTSGGRGGIQSYRGSLRLWHCGLTRPGRIGAGAQGTKRPGPPGQIRAHLQRITGRPGVVVPIQVPPCRIAGQAQGLAVAMEVLGPGPSTYWLGPPALPPC